MPTDKTIEEYADPDEPVYRTDSRTPEGITVGLIDAMISIAHVLAPRVASIPTSAVSEALLDLQADSDLAFIRSVASAQEVIKGVEPEHFKILDSLRELERQLYRRIVDACYREVTEHEAVPSTDWADRIIDKVLAECPQDD